MFGLASNYLVGDLKKEANASLLCVKFDCVMGVWMYVISFLALIVIIGNLLVLLRTANKPTIPGSVKPQPFEDEDDSGW